MRKSTLPTFDVEISLAAKPAGHFTWAVRRGGKLLERADRAYATDTASQAAALKAVERARTPGAW